jgi:hypothetical protein
MIKIGASTYHPDEFAHHKTVAKRYVFSNLRPALLITIEGLTAACGSI